MSRTYVLYQQTEHGRLRVGQFKGPAGSTRNIARTVFRRFPGLTGRLFVGRRFFACGRWVDDPEIVPLEREES